MLNHEVHLLDPEVIRVNRAKRQRREISVEDLVVSIRQRGQLQPIIVDGDTMELVAGERRLAACKELGFHVLAMYVQDLNELELRIVELEENMKRKNLTWQESAMAVAEIHDAYEQLEEGWSQLKTASALGLSAPIVSEYLSIVEEIRGGNVRVSEAKTKNTARNLVERKRERDIAAVLDDLMAEDKPKVEPSEETILNVDFHQWAKDYQGPTFNFLHCDFPYGINMQDSEVTKESANFLTYEDQLDTFTDLIDTLARYQNNLISESAHILFWFDMAKYSFTWNLLQCLDFRFFPIPLIWMKTDGTGIASDSRRRARHTYEAAFYGSRGDRPIVQTVSDTYGCPAYKEGHLSTKPEPMLRHFFRMFIDNNTSLLDPTCGSGTALRAAESLDAPLVVGLEQNEEFCISARRTLNEFRAKRKLAK